MFSRNPLLKPSVYFILIYNIQRGRERKREGEGVGGAERDVEKGEMGEREGRRDGGREKGEVERGKIEGRRGRERLWRRGRGEGREREGERGPLLCIIQIQ